MAFERTLVILKPDAREAKTSGHAKVEENAAFAEKVFKRNRLSCIAKLNIKLDKQAASYRLQTECGEKEPPQEVIRGLGERDGNTQTVTLGPKTMQKLFSAFYIEHEFSNHKIRDINYAPDLVGLMSSGQSVAMVVEGEDAIKKVRKLMGPRHVDQWTDQHIRKHIATDETNNGIHGSDSPKSAAMEIGFFEKTLRLAVPELAKSHAASVRRA